MSGNLPPGVNHGSPRAPWNQEPPMIEKTAYAVTLDVVVEHSEQAEYDEVRELIEDAIDRGEYDVVDREKMDVLDRRQA